jgi:hypothetical protein
MFMYAVTLLALVQLATVSSFKPRPIRAAVGREGAPSTKIQLRDVDDDERMPMFVEDNDKPRFTVEDVDTSKQKSAPAKTTSPISTPTRPKMSATFGSMSVDDLKSRMIKVDKPSSQPLPDRKEDLNGINPVVPILASVFPAGLAYYALQLANYLSAHFAVSFLASEYYPVQRFAVISRNIVVGMASLLTGFSGVISLGLFALGVTVMIGVLKGELDPNKKEVQSVDA